MAFAGKELDLVGDVEAGEEGVDFGVGCEVLEGVGEGGEPEGAWMPSVMVGMSPRSVPVRSK